MKNNKNGIGVLGVLQIVFITLKLTGNISWSWLWVLSPTLLPAGIVIAAGFTYAMVLLILIGLGMTTYEEAFKKTKKDEQE